MIRTALLAATAAVVFFVSPALASGPTVLTDKEMDKVVAGELDDQTTIRNTADHHGPTQVPADIHGVLSTVFTCTGANPRSGAAQCLLPLDNPGNALPDINDLVDPGIVIIFEDIP